VGFRAGAPLLGLLGSSRSLGVHARKGVIVQFLRLYAHSVDLLHNSVFKQAVRVAKGAFGGVAAVLHGNAQRAQRCRARHYAPWLYIASIEPAFLLFSDAFILIHFHN
jgi:hypothetical protein